VALGVTDDLLPDLAKVVELLPGEVEELAPLVGIVLVQVGVGRRLLGAVRQLRGRRPVDQLEDLTRGMGRAPVSGRFSL
jgi:hypothetical protein